MARVSMTFSVKLPWWYGARILTLAALAKAGFAIDMKAEAEAIVDAAKLTAD
ncbi:hypothetical protein [Devosia ginsengisoli]|uniref:hypothetical protein n=1 Tax=Devosia ginsengisoli TaxID=400770 RepID=UPI0016446D0A|nr:hypothetical protein [Devosia ginsengisoli]